MIRPYKPMLPTLVEHFPNETDWFYEVKYDGFRCLLYIEKGGIKLLSRNLNDLSSSFPEVIAAVGKVRPALSRYLPLVLDGELAIVTSPYRADFEKVQLRGRTRTASKITALMNQYPATFCAFDLLLQKGAELMNEMYNVRKQKLACLFKELADIQRQSIDSLYYVDSTREIDKLWSGIVQDNGEGIIAKKQNSKWQEGVRTTNWLKIKNWKVATFIILSLEKQNGYFHVGVVKNNHIEKVGLFSNGLNSEERQALNQIVKNNAIKEDESYIYINPSICVDIQFLDWYNDGELRQPRFLRFRLDKNWEDCTWEEALKQSMK